MVSDSRTSGDKGIISYTLPLNLIWKTRGRSRKKIIVGMILIPFFKTFEYILPYWTLDMEKFGERMRVSLMFDQNPLLSLKKTFFYSFFPSKEEEKARILNNTPHIKIKITSHEVEAGALLISYIETFDYILPYWTLDMAKILVNRYGVRVGVWDLTKDNSPRKYE
ncbi:hypothetical protein H5410_028036, partial [Solanum commersonii]